MEYDKLINLKRTEQQKNRYLKTRDSLSILIYAGMECKYNWNYFFIDVFNR